MAYNIDFQLSLNAYTKAGSGIPDAPIDGEIYGRKDAQWAPVRNVDTYTKEEIDEKLGEKQDTLIAGDNIEIEGNAISVNVPVKSVNTKTGDVVLDALDVSAGLQLTGDEMVAKLQSLPLNTIIQCKHPSGVFIRGYFYRVSGTGTNRSYVQQEVQAWHSDGRKQDRFQFSGVELANDDLSELLTVGDIVQCTSDFNNLPYANYIKGYFYIYGGGVSNFTQTDVQPTSGGAVDSVNGKTGAVVLTASDVGALPDNTPIPTKVSDLQNDSGYITLSDIPSTDSVTQGSSDLLTSGGAYSALSTKQDTLSQSQLDAVNSGIDSTKVGQITTNSNDISTIEGKIPSAASSSNQLADKDYVIENIQTNAAIFRGNYATKAALLAVQWQTSDPEADYYVTNNDYAYIEADETHNNEAWRYLYVIDDIPAESGWRAQFKVNDTPFSQAQLNAINSGITSALVSNIPTNEQIATWNNKSDFSGNYDDLENKPINKSGNNYEVAGPILISGKDGSTAKKIAISNAGGGQITNEDTATLFGFTDNNSDTLTVGHSNYNLNLRGKGSRPKFNDSADIALKSDIPVERSQGNYSVQQIVDNEAGQALALGKWSFAEGRGNNFEVSYDSKDYANSQLTVATKSGNPQAYQVRKNAILWIQSPGSMGGAWYYATADDHNSDHRDYTTLTLDAKSRTIYDGDGTSASHIVRNHSWEGIDSTWTIKVYMGAAAASDSHIEGNFNNTVWLNSDTELNEANVNRSHAEGSRTIAAGFCAHSEGENTQAIGGHTHTEGLNTKAMADCAHAEGHGTQANYANSHAEGENTQANAVNAHTQGSGTKAGGKNSFAGGYRSEVAVDHSMAHGFYVTANQQNSPIGKAAFGQYNIDNSNALFEIGNGSNSSNKSNAFEVYTDGHAEIQTQGQTNNSITNKQYVDNGLSTKQDTIDSSHKLSYTLLSDTPTIPTVPTNVSSFNNDAGYLTLETLPIYNGGVE